MMSLRHLLALLLLASSTAVWADSLNINLNNDTAQFEYGTATGLSGQGNADLHAGFLYNSANSVLVNAGIMVVGAPDSVSGLSIGAGVEGLVAVIKDNAPFKSNATALALDGLVRFVPPGASQIGIVGEVHYAPRIITFGDADRYMQAGVRMEYEVTPQTLVYVGFRRIAFGIKNGQDATVDNGGNIGIKISF
jgi:YfaZ precursor